MIHIVGTSHIAKDSIKRVRSAIKDLQPEIVAVELDRGRAYSLEHNIQRPKNSELLKILGLNGFLFYIFGEFVQKRLGNIVNVEPGAEMLAAIKAAREADAKIALIDRDIRITLRRFSKYFQKREILTMIGDFIKGIFKKDRIDVDLRDTPSDDVIYQVLDYTKKRYPSLYKVLIDERDRIMAKNLDHIAKENPDADIVAVIGAGHVRGVKRYLELSSE